MCAGQGRAAYPRGLEGDLVVNDELHHELLLRQGEGSRSLSTSWKKGTGNEERGSVAHTCRRSSLLFAINPSIRQPGKAPKGDAPRRRFVFSANVSLPPIRSTFFKSAPARSFVSTLSGVETRGDSFFGGDAGVRTQSVPSNDGGG